MQDEEKSFLVWKCDLLQNRIEGASFRTSHGIVGEFEQTLQNRIEGGSFVNSHRIVGEDFRLSTGNVNFTYEIVGGGKNYLAIALINDI